MRINKDTTETWFDQLPMNAQIMIGVASAAAATAIAVVAFTIVAALA